MIRRLAAPLFVASTIAACGGGGTAPSPSPPAGISYATPQTLTLGSAVVPVVPTVTGTVTGYAVSPPLPRGVTLDATNGTLAGTPAVTSPAATYRITASGNAGSASFDLTLAVRNTLPFWIEPSPSTTIGIGQSIDLHPVHQANASDPYPAYIDATQVTWSSSSPGCASVDASGVVMGLSACTTTISGTYLGTTRQVTVQVSGRWFTRSVSVTGQGTRSYAMYVPDFGGSATPHPALLALHGGGGSALVQASTSRLVELAQARKVYVAFLEGTGLIRTWNAGACCGSARTNNVDDVAYVRAVLDHIAATDTVDSARVFATGMSNGSMMSHRLACAAADRLAGIMAVAGGSGQFDQALTPYYACNPSRPIPIVEVHATNDRNYPFAGGQGDGLSATAYYPVDSTIADWRTRNNVTAQATVTRVTATTTCNRYATPANVALPSAPVVLCKIDPVDVFDAANEIVFGGGHAWPGGARSPSPKSDVPAMDFDLNAYGWDLLNP